MRIFVNAGDSPLAPRTAGALDGGGPLEGRSLLELVLSLAQVQYEMESRRRGGLPTDELRAAEEPLIHELNRLGVPIPQRAPRAPTRARPHEPAPGADRSHRRTAPKRAPHLGDAAS